MIAIGSKIDETGVLVQNSNGFAFRRDLGGRWLLDLHRIAEHQIEKRVRLKGVIVDNGLIDVDAVLAEA